MDGKAIQLCGRWPTYEADEIAAVEVVLRSGKVNFWTGSECTEFEKEFAAYHGVEYGVAVANGTLALELALRALGIGNGDEVIVTPRSFFASASCITLCGARPVFVDVDRDTQNITAQSIATRINDKTRAILVVHLAGWPCDMTSIARLAETHDLRLIEDCAQAHGARWNDTLVGSFGDASAFSFCQDKIMSTGGEGGMLITNCEDVFETAWSFKDHGKNRRLAYDMNHAPGFRWLHDGFGTNWRLTEMQAAIGRIQLGKLENWVQTRRRNADRLYDALADIPALRIPKPPSNAYHSYYKFYAFVRRDRLKAGWSRDRLLAALEELGVPGMTGACPEIYREQAFARQVHEVLPVARELGETSLMFRVDPALTDADIDNMISVTHRVFERASV